MKKLLPIFAVLLFSCEKNYTNTTPPPLSLFKYTIEARTVVFDSVTGNLTITKELAYNIERRNLQIEHQNGLYSITAYANDGQLAAVLRWKADSIRPWEIFSVFEDSVNKPSTIWGELILKDYNSNFQTFSVDQKYGMQIECMMASSDTLMTLAYRADGSAKYEGYQVSGQLWIGKQSFFIKP